MKERSTLEKGVFWVFCAGFIWIGAVGANQEAKRLLRNLALDRTGTKTQGNVVDYKTSKGKNGQIWPVVTFLTPTGESVTFESLSRSRISVYSMGATVPVVSRSMGFSDFRNRQVWTHDGPNPNIR